MKVDAKRKKTENTKAQEAVEEDEAEAMDAASLGSSSEDSDQRALAALPADDREVLLMRRFEDMANGEVAQALGLTDAAATMRYGRALYRLKEILMADGSHGGSQ